MILDSICGNILLHVIWTNTFLLDSLWVQLQVYICV